jgi:hypothetical protein
MRELRGSCLCRGIEYTVDDDFAYMGHCHCSECRKFSGSAFSAFGGVEPAKLRFSKGTELIARYEKKPQLWMAFCRNCGSSLFSEQTGRGYVHLRLGTLDDVPTGAPRYHVFVGSKAAWHDIRDDFPQFETLPDRRP